MSETFDSSTADYAAVLEWVRDKQHILLVTHVRPDGDACGSLFAMHALIQQLGISSTPYLRKPAPERYAQFILEADTSGGDLDLDRYDAVLSVDATNPERIALPENIRFSDIEVPICNIDHHIDNTRFGSCWLIEPERAATAEIIAAFAEACDLKIPSDAATLLILGIVMDTGGFRFSNTTPETMRQTGLLMAAGGDYHGVIDQMFFNEPINKLRLHGKIFESLKFAFDNRLAYYVITDELLASCGVDAEDTEGLIDTIRVIDTVDITCALQLAGADLRFSLRSQNPKIPINTIAHKLGGGGHAMAAGAVLKNVNLIEGTERLLEEVKLILDTTESSP